MIQMTTNCGQNMTCVNCSKAVSGASTWHAFAHGIDQLISVGQPVAAAVHLGPLREGAVAVGEAPGGQGGVHQLADHPRGRAGPRGRRHHAPDVLAGVALLLGGATIRAEGLRGDRGQQGQRQGHGRLGRRGDGGPPRCTGPVRAVEVTPGGTGAHREVEMARLGIGFGQRHLDAGQPQCIRPADPAQPAAERTGRAVFFDRDAAAQDQLLARPRGRDIQQPVRLGGLLVAGGQPAQALAGPAR